MSRAGGRLITRRFTDKQIARLCVNEVVRENGVQSGMYSIELKTNPIGPNVDVLSAEIRIYTGEVTGTLRKDR